MAGVLQRQMTDREEALEVGVGVATVTALGAGRLDAFFTVSLAGSLFFNVSFDAARPRILLYLVLTMAPFALVAMFTIVVQGLSLMEFLPLPVALLIGAGWAALIAHAARWVGRRPALSAWALRLLARERLPHAEPVLARLHPLLIVAATPLAALGALAAAGSAAAAGLPLLRPD